MKKTFLRCGSLLVAAFVLLGAVLMAAPVKANAADADSIVGLWIFNDSLVPIDYGDGHSTWYVPCDVTFADGSVISYTCFESYVEYNSGSDYEYHTINFYTYDYDNKAYVDRGFGSLYYYESDSWSEEHRPTSMYINYDSADENLRLWLNTNATFQAPPPGPGPLVEVMTDLKEQNQLSQVLTQVVMMIPIGLGCWAGYKGLRKALALLQRILHQA